MEPIYNNEIFKPNIISGYSFMKKDFENIIKSLPHDKLGVYMFLDKCNNPLYIGKSKNLKLRLYDHTKGFSKSTKDHINDFEKCSLFFVSSKHDTDLWLEALMIEEFKPPLNKMISKWRVENIKHYALLNKLFPLG